MIPPILAVRSAWVVQSDEAGAWPPTAKSAVKDVEQYLRAVRAATYTPDEASWVKIKNQAYTQAEGRADFFVGRAFRAGL